MFALAAATFVLCQTDQPYVFKSGLSIGVPGNPRTIVRRDPVEAALITGELGIPKQGDKLGNSTWSEITTQTDRFENVRGYVSCIVDWPTTEVMLLESTGASSVYANGEPRTGDPYGYGYASLPVLMNRGSNHFLFSPGRGYLAAKLVKPPARLSLDLRDPTFPDLLEGERGKLWAAVIVRNATVSRHQDLTLEVKPAKGQTSTQKLPTIMPLTTRKMPFQVDASGSHEITLILRQGKTEMDRQKITLRRLAPNRVHKRTFVSSIDGSVQYYAVNPSSKPGPNQALFLSLHGASVEALGQAEAYSSKTWGTLVAATNRRPFGFDWEEVGRLDAMEVLGIAQSALKTDPARTYLQGHSMGGHGTWQVGVHFPDKFAAIAPAASWISFATYGGGVVPDESTPLNRVMSRAHNPSNTLALLNNTKQQAVFILHGDADTTVPLSEARTMRTELAKFHTDLHWFEEPGQGHWYDTDPGPGANCVDFPPFYDLFSKRRIPAPNEIRDLDFTTVSPGISSKCQWLEVLQQKQSFAISRAQIKFIVGVGFVGTTQNIAALKLDARMIEKEGEISVDLDGGKLQVKPDASGFVTLKSTGSGWGPATVSPAEKNPARYGSWKDILRNKVVFVVGTKLKEPFKALAAKARFDAEQFWYRGNSSVEIIPDSEFVPKSYPDQNIVLYGNREENSAWDKVLGAGAPSVEPGKIKVGSKDLGGNALACYFIYPRADSKVASVGVIAGTGPIGQRLTERVPIFTAGAAIPDFFVFSPKMLTEGQTGVLAAGFFDTKWVPETDSYFSD